MSKLLFIPHCLRNINKCKAVCKSNGYLCMLCGSCSIKDIVEEAGKQNFEVYIVPGASMVKKILAGKKLTSRDVIVGLACDAELKDLKKNYFKGPFSSKNIIAIELSKDGCVNTEVDVEKVRMVLRGQP